MVLYSGNGVSDNKTMVLFSENICKQVFRECQILQFCKALDSIYINELRGFKKYYLPSQHVMASKRASWRQKLVMMSKSAS